MAEIRSELSRRGIRFRRSARKDILLRLLWISDNRLPHSPPTPNQQQQADGFSPELLRSPEGIDQPGSPLPGFRSPSPAQSSSGADSPTPAPLAYPFPPFPRAVPPPPNTVPASSDAFPPPSAEAPAISPGFPLQPAVPSAFRLPAYTLASATPLPPPPHAPLHEPPPVSPSLRQQILSGTDFDLSSLLSVFSEPSVSRDVECGPVTLTLKTTGPASRILSFPEFALAFSRYTEVVCSIFPHRRRELNDYFNIIAGLAVSYGGTHFYTYHRLFSAKCAARVGLWNQFPYWGALDLELHNRVFLGCRPVVCAICCCPDHSSSHCPFVEGNSSNHKTAAAKSSSSVPRLPQSAGSVDQCAFPRQQVCFHFNSGKCELTKCRFLHVCSYCAGAHARIVCPIVPVSNKNRKKYLSTPINVSALKAELVPHPNDEFTDYLISGLLNGFHPGISAMPSTSFMCKNLLSAVNDPETVNDLLAAEVTSGFMMGPFPAPPFPTFRINPIGVATRKYSGKKRLIVDLSAPHNSLVPSINSLVPFEDYSMAYQTVDDAVRLIKLADPNCWLFKADITAAFKVMPIHPDFWHLFGVQWNGQFYFAVRLTFGCRSSPKIFDTLSEALCWILQNNYNIKLLVHLLDDFLAVTPSSAPPSTGRQTILKVFSNLGVPISEEKTDGPAYSLEFLGITLNTRDFSTSLPKEKIDRILTVIDCFAACPNKTKMEVLSLLGHLNFAMRVIPQGRPFISHLLTAAHSVSALDTPVLLDDQCLKDLELWRLFLNQWNGLSMFYDDHALSPEDLQLYTDAAPSVGFGGYFAGQWFASAWPREMLLLPPSAASSAVYEVYPVVIAALLWGSSWSGKRVLIYCDNEAAVFAINKGRSRAPVICPFLRRLVWTAACHQFILTAAHIPGHQNAIADSLSRFAFQRFRTLAPDADPDPTPVPSFSDTIFL
ncbi:hypothetical protein ACEWY4_022762 [Coilia grayii]|uniref:ribonuclease H n=1 Tax=Coilia grayii TaxID=363190 RepID=A0ABD1J143_9TELE